MEQANQIPTSSVAVGLKYTLDVGRLVGTMCNPLRGTKEAGATSQFFIHQNSRERKYIVVLTATEQMLL